MQASQTTAQGPEQSGPLCIPPSELAGTSEVVRALELSNRSHLAYYRRKDPTFPAPVVTLAMGPVWDLRAVRLWASERRPNGTDERA